MTDQEKEPTPLEWAEYEFATIEYDFKVHPEAARRIRELFERLAKPQGTSIGYVIWDAETNAPKRNILSKGRWFERKTPTRVYKSQKVAQNYCKEGQEPKEVFVKETTC